MTTQMGSHNPTVSYELYIDGQFWGLADEAAIKVIRKQGYKVTIAPVAGQIPLRATAVRK